MPKNAEKPEFMKTSAVRVCAEIGTGRIPEHENPRVNLQQNRLRKGKCWQSTLIFVKLSESYGENGVF